MGECTGVQVTLDRGVSAVRIANSRIAATVLVDKGADIYELIHVPSGLDVLWKSPWGLRKPGGVPTAANSVTAWLEAYEGGWQEIFPSGGGPCTYKGVELNFHGEASAMAWEWDLATGADHVELTLGVRLARSPLRLVRRMRIESGEPVLILDEHITNESGEPIDYMWGHHPAFGAPFLSAACRIDTNARTLMADDAYDHPLSPVDPGRRYAWPRGGRGGGDLDLSAVPGPEAERATLAYFSDYAGDPAWFGITNTELGVGAGMVWPVRDFPHAWFWQEMHGSPGFPWYKGAYVMAIEPSTSYPGQGLVTVMQKTQTHRTLDPGETATAGLRAVLYESNQGIEGIDAAGRVTVRKG